MHRALSVAALLLVVVLAPSRAHAVTGGTSLSWNDCGSFGTDQRSFACNTNVGVNVLYGSAVVPVPLPQVDGEESTVLVKTDQPTLSSWWQMAAPNECRGTLPAAIIGSFDFTQDLSCIDPWSGQASGGIVYQSGFAGPNRAQIRTICAIPGTTSIGAGQEYYFFKLEILNERTVGNGSCSGCTNSACFVLSFLRLTQTPGAGDFDFNDAQPTRNWVTWQGGVVGGGGCPAALPARSTTWGSVKSLYR